jgi:hypothetical protein
MGVGDGTVQGVFQIRDRGPDDLRYNIVIVGEGFQAAEQTVFQDAATVFRDSLLSYEPYATEVADLINVYRLDVDSVDSGTTIPTACGVPSTARTYFDAVYCSDGLDRLLTVDNALVEDTLNAWLPEWDAAVVVVNSVGYGGSGLAPVAVYSLGTPVTVPLHEMGHAAFDLADEYEYWAGCDSGETDRNTYTDTEPDEPNVTANPDRATVKWADLIDPATPVPTTQNADCTVCDLQPNPVGAGTVGLFEGAYYYHCGAYRPEYDCMMRTNGVALCAVCRGAISGRINQSLFALDDCVVATAVYGDRQHPDVVALRDWRDRRLEPDHPARPAMTTAVAVYRTLGPPVARWLAQRPDLALPIRDRLLAPLARTLRSRQGQRDASVRGTSTSR